MIGVSRWDSVHPLQNGNQISARQHRNLPWEGAKGVRFLIGSMVLRVFPQLKLLRLIELKIQAV
jgi:hypothetical protein